MNSKESWLKINSSVITQMGNTISARKEFLKSEIANTINMVADRKSIPALISLLKDPDFDIRWIATEGLIKVGRRSIIPLLKSIRDGDSSYFLNRSAHHILLSLINDREKSTIEPLLFCLYNHTEVEKAPVEATAALKGTFRSKT